MELPRWVSSGQLLKAGLPVSRLCWIWEEDTISMSHHLSSEPLREGVRALATSWESSYLLRSDDPLWWHFDPIIDRQYRRQGWKLHVSAVPNSAISTMRLVADVVMARGLRWKVTRSLRHLSGLCTPPAPITQVGKFSTVYVDDENVADLAAELHDVTKLF